MEIRYRCTKVEKVFGSLKEVDLLPVSDSPENPSFSQITSFIFCVSDPEGFYKPGAEYSIDITQINGESSN